MNLDLDFYLEGYTIFGKDEMKRVDQRKKYSKEDDDFCVVKNKIFYCRYDKEQGIRDISAMRALLNTYGRTYNKHKMEGLRVHMVDIRDNYEIPFFKVCGQKLSISDLRERVKTVKRTIENIKNSYIYNKIVRNINACDEKVQAVLFEELEFSIQIWNMLLKPFFIGGVQTFFERYHSLKRKLMTEDKTVFEAYKELIQITGVTAFINLVNRVDTNTSIEIIKRIVLAIHNKIFVKFETINSIYMSEITNKNIRDEPQATIFDMISYLSVIGSDTAFCETLVALIDFSSAIMDIYTVARMFRNFKDDISPYNIMYYGGEAHSINIRRILNTLGLNETVFRLHRSFDKSGGITSYPNCIPFGNIKKYSDFFKR